MQKSLLLVFLAITLGVFSLRAQENPLYENTESPRFPFKFNNDGGSNDDVNHFIDKIAQGFGKGNSLTQYAIGFKQYGKIIKDQAGQYQASLILKDFFADGDYTFKGFPLGDVLIPSTMDFAVDVLRNNQVFKSFPFQNISTDGIASKPLQFSFADSTPNANYALKVRDVKFNYGQADRERFDERITQIGDFLGFQKDFGRALVDIQHINPADAEHIFDEDNALKNIESLIGDFQAKNFPERLHMSPAELSKYSFASEQVYTLAGQLRQQINQTIATLDQYYFNKGTEMLLNGNEAGATQMFNKSLDRNPGFIPAIYQLAKIDYHHGNMDAAADKVTTILSRMRPDDTYRDLGVQLGQNIYENYLQTADNLLTAKSWDKAIDGYNKADAFAQTTNGLLSDSRVTAGIAKARNGIYQSYLTDARKALNNRDYDGSEKIVLSAKQYAAQYPDAIASTSDADVVMLSVKQGQYKTAVDKGAYLVQHSQARQAFTVLQNAENIQTDYAVVRDKRLPGLLKTSAKPIILDALAEASNNVSNMAAATAQVKQAKIWMSRYGLEEDKEVKAAYTAFTKTLFNQECKVQMDAYQDLLSKGDNAAAYKDFIQATNLYNQAIAQKNTKTECMLDTREAEQKMNAIAPAAEYQNRLAAIEKLVYNAKFDNAIQQYISLGEFYQQNQLNNYLPHMPLFNYLSSHSNAEFTLAGARYFATMGEGQNAVALLKSAMAHGYSSRDTKSAQVEAAGMIATSDAKASGGHGDYNKKIAEYTQGNKSLKYFAKAYRKQWKRLAS